MVACACSSPFPFDHLAIFSLVPLVDLPIAIIFSAIFSQTRGTPRKTVGLTHLRRSPIVPTLRSYGRAKLADIQPDWNALTTIGQTMSTIMPATWLSGR